MRGSCYWYLNPDLRGQPPPAGAPWDVEQGIYWAQTTYCLRRALAAQPRHRLAWHALYDSCAARDMLDEQLTAGEQWLRADPRLPRRQRFRMMTMDVLGILR